MERRDFLTMTGGLAGAILLTSCTERQAAAPSSPAQAGGTPKPPAHVLYADVSTQLSAIDAGSGATIYSAARPLPAADWSRLYTVSPTNELVTLDARTGKELDRTAVPPGLVPRVVSPLGTAVALGAPAPASPYGKPGRSTTTLVIAHPSGDTKPRVIRLDGNVEPDSFSTGGDVLFLLQYLPATAPESYRVRAYHIVEGLISPLLTREKRVVPEGAEETMRGEGRIAVLGPARQRLYTLYTHQPDHLHTRDLVAGRTGGVHAFVHVLDLGQGWAYCLDLPEPFGRGPAEGHTLAVCDMNLYAYDGASGTLVQASTESLEIQRTAVIGASAGAASVAWAEGLLYIAAGPSLRAVDRASLTVQREWRLPSAARGVAVGPGGRDVYVGVTDGVERFGRDGGRDASHVAVPGISQLRYVADQPA